MSEPRVIEDEPADREKSMSRAFVVATQLSALSVAPAAPSSFKVRGHDRVTLGNDLGEGSGPQGGTRQLLRTGFWLGWDGRGCQKDTDEGVVRLLNFVFRIQALGLTQ